MQIADIIEKRRKTVNRKWHLIDNQIELINKNSRQIKPKNLKKTKYTHGKYALDQIGKPNNETEFAKLQKVNVQNNK